MVSEEMLFENADGRQWTTDDEQRMPYYTISSPLAGELKNMHVIQ